VESVQVIEGDESESRRARPLVEAASDGGNLARIRAGLTIQDARTQDMWQWRLPKLVKKPRLLHQHNRRSAHAGMLNGAIKIQLAPGEVDAGIQSTQFFCPNRT